MISEYIRNNQAKYGHYHAPTLIKALEIVMQNNIMKFGNEFRKQSAGTAMGKPPAPAWATIFEELHELDFFSRLKYLLILLKRFIDDGFGIWIPPAETSDKEAEAKWVDFQADFNDDS